jgi:hypothetical protein
MPRHQFGQHFILRLDLHFQSHAVGIVGIARMEAPKQRGEVVVVENNKNGRTLSVVRVRGFDRYRPSWKRTRPPQSRRARKKGQRLLTEVEAGPNWTITSVYERDRKLLEFFNREGIRPARPKPETDGTVSLYINRRKIRLGIPAAAKILGR